MIVRVVRLGLKDNYVKAFRSHFSSIKETIVSSKGCFHVSLFEDQDQKNILYTYSIWQSESDLNLYRESSFFKQTWQKVKPMFAHKAQAHSFLVNSLKNV